jgi:AcrR family transcriptional regulator
MGRNKTIEDEDVLAVARRVFREAGHAVSTREIARAVGVSQAVLFQRFGSKEELFFRAMTPELPDLEALLGDYPRPDPFDGLVAMAERLLSFLKVLAFPDLDATRLHAWHAELPFRPIVTALTGRFAQMRDDGLLQGDPRACATAFIGVVHFVAFVEVVAGPGERAGHRVDLRAMLEVLWNGLDPGECAPRPRTKRAAKATRARQA